ncbi:hypothetical protein D9M71_700090 [compost metagenome]
MLETPKKGASSFSLLNSGGNSRGKALSAAPNWLWSKPEKFSRLLSSPVTVRKPIPTRMFGNRDNRSAPPAWASAMRIWSRMKSRSPRTSCTPGPLAVIAGPGSTAVVGVGGVKSATAAVGAENTCSVTPLASW